LLGNQVPLLRALRIARDAIGLDGFAAEIDAAVGRVADGGKLSDVLSGSAYVPADIAAMVAVGEQSNSLDAVLVDAANVVERRAARRLDLLLKMLEPALLVVLAAIVLFLVIGLMLPIFDASAAVE
jgi:general secretion pathway protein F/type IV pilus assembly protein PilC